MSGTYNCLDCGYAEDYEATDFPMACPNCHSRHCLLTSQDKRLRKPRKQVTDRPLKGSQRWYKERWFRKDQKTWEEDIRSRQYIGDGQAGRFNEKGDRIG